MPQTAPVRLRRLDLVREACRRDPAFRLPPKEKLERIALPWVVSPEDLILQKLKAQRQYDFTDAVLVLEEQRGGLDRESLDPCARRLRVEQELAEVMAGGTDG